MEHGKKNKRKKENIITYQCISINIFYFSSAIKKYSEVENFLVVGSRTKKRRRQQTINVMACNKEKKRFLKVSVLGCSTF